MTPTEFELLTKRLLTKKLKENFGKKISISHKKKLTSLRGNTYEVDLTYLFSMFDIQYLTIVECKHWDSFVTREKIGYFKSILEDLNAHKGIVFTTKGFQKGAIAFAKSNGIGLIKITNDNYFEVYSHADGGIEKIIEMLNIEEELKENIFHTSIGMFYPRTNPLEFIRIHYGSDLENYLENESSPEILDKRTRNISPKVIQQLNSLSDSWYEEYYLTETCGLGFKLENEPYLRVLNILLSMLKVEILNNSSG